MNTARYARQTRLPGFGPAQQEKLASARILAVGAGGLGAVLLPVLAGAGVGHITIVDSDTIDISNLHRQTIYTTDQVGQPKAECTAAYLKALNPDVNITFFIQKIEEFEGDGPYDLILDGTDNFAAKTFINDWALQNGVPLIAASVNQFEGQCGVFAGHLAGAPCYRCLFPDLPDEAPNCATAGVLGSVPGIAGLYQAHLALLFLTGLGDARPGTFLQFDFMGLRSTRISVPKNQNCPSCTHGATQSSESKAMPSAPPLVSYADLPPGFTIVDVREAEELELDPIPHPSIHIPLMQIPERLDELPQHKPLAFVCAGNIRSRHAAEYLAGLGYERVMILDKFSL